MATPAAEWLRRNIASLFARTRARAAGGMVALLLPTALLAFWQFAVSSGIWPNTLIASPADVARDFWSLLRSGELLAHARVSLGRLITGFGLGSLAGIIVATIVGVSKGAERAVKPTLSALLPIPPTAWIPLLIIVLGIEEASKIALIAIGAFTIVYANTLEGIRGADRQFVELARVFEKPRSSMIGIVLLPSAAPSIFTGMRVALGLSWILLVAAELVSARMASASVRLEGLGLGWLIYDARRFSRMDDMIVGMVAIALLGAGTDRLVGRIQNTVLKWRQTFEGM